MVQRRCKEDLQKDIQSIYDKEKIEALTPTAATLLVVPKPLLNHWHVSIYLRRLCVNNMSTTFNWIDYPIFVFHVGSNDAAH
jgi:hypothetical protein